MTLSDFYHPIGVIDFFWTIFLFIVFETTGTFIARLFRAPSFTRSYWWVIGLSLFVFFWWILRPLIGFNRTLILILLLILLIPSAILYYRGRFWGEWHQFKDLILVQLITLVPLMPALLIKISLPPYFGDEMYHYYSPAEILYPEKIQVVDNVYTYIPQALDNFYRLTFVLTHSYVVARLFHLLIILSSFINIGNWLKSKFDNNRVVLIWLLISPYLATNFTSQATSGFVDIATSATVLVALTTSWQLISTKDFRLLPLISIFWTIAASFKYSALIPIASTLLISFPFLLPQFFKKVQNIFFFLFSIIITVPFGSYSYLSNWINKGSPIYPLNNFKTFFAGWTIPLSLSNLPAINKEFFIGSLFLAIPLLSAFQLLPFVRAKNKSFLLLAVSLLLEIFLVSKLMGGFLNRYYSHWIFLSGLIMLSPLLHKKDNLIFEGYTLLFLAAFTLQAIFILKFIYGSYFTPPKEIRFTLRQDTINDWVTAAYPETHDIISYCATGNFRRLFIFDPELVWYSINPQIKGFFVNCLQYYYDLGKQHAQLSNLNPGPTLILASTHSCLPDNQLPDLIRSNNWGEVDELIAFPYALKQRTLNNHLVCKAKSIAPFIYEITTKEATQELKRFDLN